jgi:hypothetical protein
MKKQERDKKLLHKTPSLGHEYFQQLVSLLKEESLQK